MRVDSVDLKLLLRAISAAAVLLLVLQTTTVYAQLALLEEAETAYRQGDYDRCIEICSGMTEGADFDAADRAEALRYLGRSYVAKRMDAEAQQAIQRLIELEPPLMTLDADQEPPPLMSIYYDVRRRTAGSFEVERLPGYQTMAIIDFTNNSLDQRERFEGLGWGLPSMMITQLNGATNLKVVERERLQWLLNELDLQASPERVDQETAVRMGKLLGAHTVLLGSFIVQGSRIRMDARLVDVETSEVLMGEEVTGRHRQFFSLAQRLSLRVAQAINVSLSRTQIGVRTETRSLDAMLSYADGIALLEKEAYRAAYEKFLEALDYDPSYSRARRKAESIRPMISTG
jgi:TolB-like protein